MLNETFSVILKHRDNAIKASTAQQTREKKKAIMIVSRITYISVTGVFERFSEFSVLVAFSRQ